MERAGGGHRSAPLLCGKRCPPGGGETNRLRSFVEARFGEGEGRVGEMDGCEAVGISVSAGGEGREGTGRVKTSFSVTVDPPFSLCVCEAARLCHGLTAV